MSIDETTDSAPVFVRLDDVSRSFGATMAVRHVTMDLAVRGKIHALVGENGAGKSTCLGIAAGRIPPSSGAILVEGAELPLGSPRASKRLGIHAIYQELTIVPGLTPEANVFLGQNIAKASWLDERAMRRDYESFCEQVGVVPAMTRRSGSLSIADQQVIEIIRALASDAKCILFDEPTAALAHAERAGLFATMHELRRRGLALTLVSHNLEEVLENSDDITVFRDGQVVETRAAAEWNKAAIVEAMLGGNSSGAQIASGRHHERSGRSSKVMSAPPVLRVRGLSSPGIIEGIDFDLYPGEILGIAGLVGSGRTSVLRAVAGLDADATGHVETSPDQVSVPKSVVIARRRGIALLPEDRKGQGLLLARSGADNITLGEWHGLTRFSLISDRKLVKASIEASGPVGFNTARINENVARLSGGNQQKIMIARWLHTDHTILLADEPTRGVDVGAKAEILVALERVVEQGRSVIVVSSELEEVVGLSDRVLVVDKGRALGTLDSADGPITVATILKMIFDAAADHPSEGGD